MSPRPRLEIELERLQHARVHVVGADQHGQFHDPAIVEMRLELCEDGIRHDDLARHAVGISQHRALARVEKIRPAPVLQGLAFCQREPVRQRQRRHMLAQHVLRPGEIAQADDHDLAQPPVERGFPAHRIGMVEPAFRQRRSIEQHAVDVDQLAAPAGTEFLDQARKLGMCMFLDQANACHRSLSFRISQARRPAPNSRACCATAATTCPTALAQYAPRRATAAGLWW